MPDVDGVNVKGPIRDRYDEILTDEALAFLRDLHRTFDTRRQELLQDRAGRRQRIRQGETPTYPDETASVREGDWTVGDIPEDLQRRVVEITGPTDRKMMINALNSGADVFMADLEDSNSPTWDNVVQGQVNLADAVREEITFTKDDGTRYELDDETATLLVRPRGWHLDEEHIRVDGEPLSGSLMDFGLYFFHNARELLDRGTGPYFYLAKLENRHEARLWNEVFEYAQDALDVDRGTIKATVLLEHVLAAFEMEEILYELREHSAGLNAGRWDYIFSIIKTFRHDPDAVLPDRGDVTMTVPFMKAYTDRLVHVCHNQGAPAIGGMAAFIPSSDPEVNERAFEEVRQDKAREASDGFDGTWVAHPGLVDVAGEEFEKVLDGADNQYEETRPDVDVAPKDILDFRVPDGEVTEDGLRQNIGVGVLYLESWLRGTGAAAIYNLMEDTATAEISRSQVWQWVNHDATLEDGRTVTPELVREIADDEMENIRGILPDERYPGRFEDARELFERVALDDDFHEFLTHPAYDYID
jgi:malate synthase